MADSPEGYFQGWIQDFPGGGGGGGGGGGNANGTVWPHGYGKGEAMMSDSCSDVFAA